MLDTQTARSCWRPDLVGVPPMFLWSCLATAGAGGPTGGGWQQLLGGAAGSLNQPCGAAADACTARKLPLLEDKGILAPVLIFTQILTLIFHAKVHLQREGQIIDRKCLMAKNIYGRT